jgi:hypothetical protein
MTLEPTIAAIGMLVCILAGIVLQELWKPTASLDTGGRKWPKATRGPFSYHEALRETDDNRILKVSVS